MREYFFIILLSVLCAANVFGEETFIFKSESKIYDVKVRVESCDDGERETICNAAAVVYLMKKNRAEVLQTIEIEETYLTIGGDKRKNGDVTELFGDEHGGIYFSDYNFDGVDDLAVSNGNYLPYNGVSYDVFLYSKRQRRFVKNKALSALETEKMSVRVNRKLRIIETETKAGCCWSEKERFRFVNNRLQKFYVFTTEFETDGKTVSLTTERRVNGKWRTSTKTMSVRKFYKLKGIE
ncbi:MAG TPA: FG-GAP repeat protein [Pyrinomonadaceae bacterium]|jgi:hypothetical protein